MAKTPRSFKLSDATTEQLRWLADNGRNGNTTAVVEIAVDRMFREERSAMNAREFVAHNQTILGGPATEEELSAAIACGPINSYMLSVDEVVAAHQAKLPEGWMLSFGSWTHESHLPAPRIPAAVTDPILMGFIRVRAGDPHFPVWLWQRAVS